VTYNTISAGSYVSINSSNNNYQITATGYSLIGLNNDLRITKITLNNLGIIAGDPSPNGTVAITRGTSTPVSSGCVSYGYQAGQTSQSINAVALGYQAGKTSQGTGTVAIGSASGQTLQSAGAVAIGDNTGNNLQSSGAVAIGTLAGQSSQGIGAVAIGYGTGSSSQGSYAVALGFSSGQTSQGTKSVAIGNSSGVLSQGANSIAVGIYEGNKLQGSGSIAIGLFTGDNTQGSNSIAIGLHAGETLLGVNSISIGSFSNHEVVGNNVISIGSSAGQVLTGDNSIAIGTSTATAATAAVIIGRSSNSGGVNTVNIGANSNTVGDYSISIGYLNSANNDNSICFGTSCGDVVEGSLNFANVQPYTAILSAKSIPIYWNSTPYYVPIYDSVDTLNNTFYFNLIRNRQYNGPAFNMMFNNTSIVLSGVNDNLIYDSLNARFVANYSAVYMVTAQMCLNISASGTNIESSWSFMRNGDVILQFPFNYLNSQTKSGNVTAMAAFRMNVTAGDTIEFPVSLNFSISGYSTNTISLTNDTGNRNYVLFEHI
jgi:hypothetical protein